MFDFFTKGYFGYYNEIFMEVAYLHKKRTNEIINYFTIFKAIENRGELKEEELKLNEISNEFNIGIVRKFISQGNLLRIYSDSVQYNYFKDNDVVIKCGKFKVLEKQFVSCNSQHSLKNLICPSRNSYIFELFDKDKKELATIFENHQLLEKANSIFNINGINLLDIPERIGNIIFEFPNGIIKDIKREEDLSVIINWDSRFQDKDKAKLKCIFITDNEINNTFILSDLIDGNRINFPKKSYYQSAKVVSTVTNLTLLDISNCKISGSASVAKVLDGYRVLNSGEKIEISMSPGTISIGEKEDEVLRLVKQSLNIKKRKKNEEDLKFKQYGIYSKVSKDQAHNAAISDIIKLIRKYGSQGFYIWDPYLNAKDLIKIVVNTYKFTSQVYALTSSKIYKKFRDIEESSEDKTLREKWFNFEQKEFSNASNNFGLNLEYRCAFGIPEASFHDRFLIFPKSYYVKENRVWSLGISLNQFGKEHHILHEVEIPDYIVSSFEELWELSNNPKNIIVKYSYSI